MGNETLTEGNSKGKETPVAQRFTLKEAAILLQISEVQLSDWSSWPVVQKALSNQGNEKGRILLSRKDIYIFAVLKFLFEQQWPRAGVEEAIEGIFLKCISYCRYLSMTQDGNMRLATSFGPFAAV